MLEAVTAASPSRIARPLGPEAAMAVEAILLNDYGLLATQEADVVELHEWRLTDSEG